MQIRLVGVVVLLRRAEIIRHHELGDDLAVMRDSDVVFFGDGDVEGLRVKHKGEEDESGWFHMRGMLARISSSSARVPCASHQRSM